jgi:arginyl-tRNA synthetase
MSSRKGNILEAAEVLTITSATTAELIGSADPDITVGAIKYAFLKQRIGPDVVYDPVESVTLIGNSGPYLQYAHARARSVLAKLTLSDNAITDLETAERSLARKITEYPEVIDHAVADLMPHHVCNYLYELAQIFNQFYEHNRVIGDPRHAVRAKLMQAYADTLKNGLQLLDIATPNHL